MGAAGINVVESLIIFLLLIAIVLPFRRIFGKAGYSPWLGMLILVPLINLIALYFLAYSQWPALSPKRARASDSAESL